jgi:Bacterial PH domain
VSYSPTAEAPSTAPLPRDPFPPQFLEPGETVLASVKPRLRAYLGLPALAMGAISVGALASVGAVAGASGPETALVALFVVAFVVNNLLWARWLGRGVLVLLPLSFFVAFIVAALASVPSGSVTAAQIRTIVVAELPVFLVLELALPFGMFLLAWFHGFYAVTDQRVIVVSGIRTRSSEWVALANVGPITARQSRVGRRLGYGRIRFVDRHPRSGPRRGPSAWILGREVVGAEFFGVAEPDLLRGQLEQIVAPARQVDATGGSVIPAPPAPARVPAAPSGPMPLPTPTDPLGVARCPRCATPLVYVAPASRFYCPSCGRYV